MKTTLTLRETAELLERTERTIGKWVALGLLPVLAIRNGTRRVCRATVEAMRKAIEEAREALTYEKAAEMLGFKPRTVRQYAALGWLTKVKAYDGRMRVSRASVEAMLEGGKLREGDATALVSFTRA